MNGRSELRIFRAAHPTAARPLRHALRAFLDALDVEEDAIEDILIAVGEALANALEHAYAGIEIGIVELHARLDDGEALSVDVCDDGHFVERESRPGRGFGLRIVKTVARSVSVEIDNGTRVCMVFEATPRSTNAKSAAG